MPIGPSSQITVLVHYYRAMVGRADVWRMRMDTATHWAIGATAAIVSFCLSDPNVPHYVLSIAFLMTVSFLLLEARRLTFYHLFQQRALILERQLIRAAVTPIAEAATLEGAAGRGGAAGLEGAAAAEAQPFDTNSLSAELAPHLGQTVPTMPLVKAIARRLRRVYLYLIGIQLLAWVFKLVNHPAPTRDPAELLSRAHVGAIPGDVVVGLAAVSFLSALLVAAVRGGVHPESAR